MKMTTHDWTFKVQHFLSEIGRLSDATSLWYKIEHATEGQAWTTLCPIRLTPQERGQVKVALAAHDAQAAHDAARVRA